MFVLEQGQSTGEVVSRARCAGVFLSTTHHTADECTRGLHYHERSHLCLLLAGADVETRGAERYRREAGSLYFYRAGEAHAAVARDGTSRHANIEFDAAFFTMHGLTEAAVDAAVVSKRGAPFLVLRIQREVLQWDDLSPLAIESLLLDLVSPPVAAATSTRPRWVRQLDAIVSDRWSERLTLAELAAATGTHPVTISKHFRRYFGTTLGDHVRGLRVARSLPLVANSRLPLSEIALRAGFADQSHFTRAFRTLTGFSPGAYRTL